MRAVQLSYTSIRSPIDRAHRQPQRETGQNVVMANSQELVTINQVEPIYVTSRFRKLSCRPSSATWRSGNSRVRAGPQDSPRTRRPATLTFIDTRWT